MVCPYNSWQTQSIFYLFTSIINGFHLGHCPLTPALCRTFLIICGAIVFPDGDAMYFAIICAEPIGFFNAHLITCHLSHKVSLQGRPGLGLIMTDPASSFFLIMFHTALYNIFILRTISQSISRCLGAIATYIN